MVFEYLHILNSIHTLRIFFLLLFPASSATFSRSVKKHLKGRGALEQVWEKLPSGGGGDVLPATQPLNFHCTCAVGARKGGVTSWLGGVHVVGTDVRIHQRSTIALSFMERIDDDEDNISCWLDCWLFGCSCILGGLIGSAGIRGTCQPNPQTI